VPRAAKAPKLRKKSVATDPVSMAGSLVRFGMLYSLTEDLAQAESLLSRGLAICEKAVGSEKSDTTKAVYALAVSYQLMGNYDQDLPSTSAS